MHAGIVDWLLFSLVRHGNEICALMLEVIANHDYDKSRFLRGAAITAVVPPECEGGNCALVMCVRKGDFNSNWFCYAMNDKTVRYQVEVVQYGAAQEQSNISHAINFWIATPPLEEQNNIAAFLDTETAKFDPLTLEANRAIALLQERRSALISAAVTGKIDVRHAVTPAEAGVQSNYVSA